MNPAGVIRQLIPGTLIIRLVKVHDETEVEVTGKARPALIQVGVTGNMSAFSFRHRTTEGEGDVMLLSEGETLTVWFEVKYDVTDAEGTVLARGVPNGLDEFQLDFQTISYASVPWGHSVFEPGFLPNPIFGSDEFGLGFELKVVWQEVRHIDTGARIGIAGTLSSLQIPLLPNEDEDEYLAEHAEHEHAKRCRKAKAKRTPATTATGGCKKQATPSHAGPQRSC